MQELDCNKDEKRQVKPRKRVPGKIRRKRRLKHAIETILNMELDSRTEELLIQIVRTFRGCLPDKFTVLLLDKPKQEAELRKNIKILPYERISILYINRITDLGKTLLAQRGVHYA